ncbi:transposase [Paenibacillus thiaminolyticus]
MGLEPSWACRRVFSKEGIMEPVIGMDISKGNSVIQAFLRRNEPYGKAEQIYHNEQGLERLCTLCTELKARTGTEPVVIMEATGHYHRGLVCYLAREEIRSARRPAAAAPSAACRARSASCACSRAHSAVSASTCARACCSAASGSAAPPQPGQSGPSSPRSASACSTAMRSAALPSSAGPPAPARPACPLRLAYAHASVPARPTAATAPAARCPR